MTEVREAAGKRIDSLTRFTPILENLHGAITGSSVYRDFSKKRPKELADEVSLWIVVIENIFGKSEELMEICRKDENFTLSGFNKGLTMALMTLREYNDTRSALVSAKKSLDESLEKAYQLYHALLWLPVEITRLRSEQIENAKDKYLPTADDLNPNMRFVDNRLVEVIGNSKEMDRYFKSDPGSVRYDFFTIKQLLDDILKSDIYSEYMAAPSTDFTADCEFWRSVIKNIILPSDTLAEALEEQSVYWNDDLQIMGTFVLKTMKRLSMSDNESLELLPMFKDEEDADFGPKLFSSAVNGAKEYRELIDKFINESQWDPDRLAFMDIVIMTAAIAELLKFPSIPVPVTLNEYIEIANFYSTQRSGQFINGILYSVINYLKSEGKLDKEF